MPQRGSVLRNIDTLPKQRVSALLAAGWARVVAKVGKGAFADRLEISTRTVEHATSSTSVPELHTALNSLCVDPTALDELFASYGFRLCPLRSDAANDLVTAAGVIDAMGELVKSLSDGMRDHNETLAVAALLRPHMPAVSAIIREADELRGAA